MSTPSNSSASLEARTLALRFLQDLHHCFYNCLRLLDGETDRVHRATTKCAGLLEEFDFPILSEADFERVFKRGDADGSHGGGTVVIRLTPSSTAISLLKEGILPTPDTQYLWGMRPIPHHRVLFLQARDAKSLDQIEAELPPLAA